MRSSTIHQFIVNFNNEPYYFTEEHTTAGAYYDEYIVYKTYKLMNFYEHWEEEIWQALREAAEKAKITLESYLDTLVKDSNIIIRDGQNFTNKFKIFIADHIISQEN